MPVFFRGLVIMREWWKSQGKAGWWQYSNFTRCLQPAVEPQQISSIHTHDDASYLLQQVADTL